MKSKKVLSLLLACAVTVSMGTTVFASTEDQIAAAQAQKQEAQAGLAQAQANISGLESKKQELESYLAELNSQYNELTDSISSIVLPPCSYMYWIRIFIASYWSCAFCFATSS